MAAKKYTLTQKRSVRGPVENGKAAYVYEKGDIINQKEYDALTTRHKDQFEEGSIDLFKKSNPKDADQDTRIDELEARIEKLEAAMTAATAEDAKDAEKSAKK